ncbi:uncharacterized protein LOC142986169 [Anticarsia gemmatalis]|uniref:uncharacterized protein LOC142986169 n=1 Tax=Anticarsia gemmatalis TaxID=129554 RepID=UPI003F76843B
MKTFIALAFLVAGISASPYYVENSLDISTSDEERIVTGNIVSAIEKACQSIKDAGLDPLHIEKQDSKYALPVPVIYNSESLVEEVRSTGLSNVVIHRMNYAVVTSRLTFDIELPLISFSIGSASAEATLFGSKMGVKASGSVDVRSIRVTGTIRVNVGVISGISIRSVDITFALKGIDSKVKLVIQEKDYSEIVNKFLGSTIPDTLKTYSSEINELLGILLLEAINENLSSTNSIL